MSDIYALEARLNEMHRLFVEAMKQQTRLIELGQQNGARSGAEIVAGDICGVDGEGAVTQIDMIAGVLANLQREPGWREVVKTVLRAIVVTDDMCEAGWGETPNAWAGQAEELIPVFQAMIDKLLEG